MPTQLQVDYKFPFLSKKKTSFLSEHNGHDDRSSNCREAATGGQLQERKKNAATFLQEHNLPNNQDNQ
jgi:hypothetical protein